MKKLTNVEITLEQFMHYIQSGYNHFINVEVQDTGEMKYLDLSGMTFEYCYLALDFTGSMFRETNFKACNLKTCVFESADLSCSCFLDCALCSTNFKNAKVDHIVFERNYFHSYLLDITDLYSMINEGL